jgi:uncharacterized protein DUF2877
MSAVRAASISPFAAAMLAGPVQEGHALGGGYVVFGDSVLAITQPGAPRMPNGLEVRMSLVEGDRVGVGAGALRTSTTTVVAGALWDPRPRPRIRLALLPHRRLNLSSLAGRGPGLTPLGDDILIGYLAGSALAGASFTRRLAASCAGRTTALSRTLLALAAEGQLPEAAHLLLVAGDLRPLLAFGATSGRGIAVGLGLAGGVSTRSRVVPVALSLPLEQPAWQFRLVIERPENSSCS